jgi:hypothetical protein
MIIEKLQFPEPGSEGDATPHDSLAGEVGQPPYFPPATLLLDNETLKFARQVAGSASHVDLEVLAVETLDDAEAAAQRIEEVRSLERERTGTNRIEGHFADPAAIFAQRGSKTPIIITSRDSERLNIFWQSVRALQAAGEQD